MHQKSKDNMELLSNLKTKELWIEDSPLKTKDESDISYSNRMENPVIYEFLKELGNVKVFSLSPIETRAEIKHTTNGYTIRVPETRWVCVYLKNNKSRNKI